MLQINLGLNCKTVGIIGRNYILKNKNKLEVLSKLYECLYLFRKSIVG